MIGGSISHYTVLEKVAEGGMGEVYKATDTRLKRTVALKFLRKRLFENTDEKVRFIAEARSAGSLDHPNICTIYDIDEIDGRLFIAMAYIEGQSLRQVIEDHAERKARLTIEEIIRIACKTAEGLGAAHKKNLLHFDVSPGNIMVADDGQIKITDFGLARRADLQMTGRMGKTTGTMAYMSPEQARGDPADPRTDIWSLGVCLYQMLTGDLPFQGDHAPAVFYSIVNEDPHPVKKLRPDTPIELATLVNKAIAKDADDRYASADEMIDALRGVLDAMRHGANGGNGARTAQKDLDHAIAVLPFTNMSADPEQEFFCDGITEDILNGLAQVEGLRVVARTSSFAFRHKVDDIREIGNRLGVGMVLEGSVRKSGDRIRITAQLINVANGYHVWSDQYDRKLEDVFAIQDEISDAIVQMLKLKMVDEAGKGFKRYTQNLDAYTHYLKGRYYWNKRNEWGINKGISYFQRAIDEDPSYAIAYAGLADSYNLLGFYSIGAPLDVFPKAVAAANKALELDDQLADGYTSLGFAKMFHEWDWAGAEEMFLKAIELSPDYPTANHWYAEYLVLRGGSENVVEQSQKALRSDPLSLIIHTLLGWLIYFERKYDDAIEQYGRTLEMDSRFVPANFFQGLAMVKAERYDEAIARFERASDLFGRSNVFLAARGYAYACAGRNEEARRVLLELDALSAHEHVPYYFVAATYAGMGEMSDAAAWLSRAYHQRDSWLTFLKVDPIWDCCRGEEALEAMLRRIGLD